MTNARLLKIVRHLAQDAETMAAAARKLEKELSATALLGTQPADPQVVRYVKRIERAGLRLLRSIGMAEQARRDEPR